MFNGSKYLTKGINEKISLELQIFIWSIIEEMPEPKDYLQIFKLTAISDGIQKIIHCQEVPKYKAEYIVITENAVNEKIYVIDDWDYSTMLLADEY